MFSKSEKAVPTKAELRVKREGEAAKIEAAKPKLSAEHVRFNAIVEGLRQRVLNKQMRPSEAEAYYKTCDELLAAWPEKP